MRPGTGKSLDKWLTFVGSAIGRMGIVAMAEKLTGSKTDWSVLPENRELLRRASLRVHDPRVYCGPVEHVRTVLQGEFAFLPKPAASQAGFPGAGAHIPKVLSSVGAGPCVILVLSNSDFSEICVGHFDVYTDVHMSFCHIVEEFHRRGVNSLEARIFSSSPSQMLLTRVLRALNLWRISLFEYARQQNVAVEFGGTIYDGGNILSRDSKSLNEAIAELQNTVNLSRDRFLALREQGVRNINERLYLEFRRPLREHSIPYLTLTH